MAKVDKCAKCGCGAVIQRAMVIDRSQGGEQDLNFRVDAQPTALVFKKSARAAIHAYICSACGFTELYADDPAKLHEAFLAGQPKSSSLDLG